MAPITIRFGGYQGPASVHTRAGHALGSALAETLADDVECGVDSHIVERGHKASDLF